MARPSGQLEAQKQKLLAEVVAGNGHLTDRELGERLGVSSRQTSQYIRELKRDGFIATDTHRLGPAGRWGTRRTITALKERG